MKLTVDIPEEFIVALADAIALRISTGSMPNKGSERKKWLTHVKAAEYIGRSPSALYKLISNK